jgi:hypothetical protein
MLLTAAAFLIAAPLAIAQDMTPTVAGGTTRGIRAAADSLTFASTEEAAQASGGMLKKLVPRVFIGFLTSAGSTGDEGFVIGGGVAARPMKDRRHEFQGNFDWQIFDDDVKSIGFDLDYYYNFNAKLGAMSPYAGAGIVVTHAMFGGDRCDDDFEDCGDTETNFLIGGGVKKRLKNGKEFFGELQIVFGDYSPVIFRGGIGW